MINLVSISSNRADISIIEPIWSKLVNKVELNIILTGSHGSNDHYARSLIPKKAKIYNCNTNFTSSKPENIAIKLSESVKSISKLLKKINPDYMLIVGDRLDMFHASMASLPFNIPLIHIHGGELTYGAIDDRIRHALTKLSHLHFVSNIAAAKNIDRMGEESWRICVSGAPSLDGINELKTINCKKFKKKLNLPNLRNFRIVTIHPETNSKNPIKPLEKLLKAIKKTKFIDTIFTSSNNDPFGNEFNKMIKEFILINSNCYYFENLGKDTYFNALRHAKYMIGNSSSGLIEAPLYGLPVINIGDRQKGRIQGKNILNSQSSVKDIVSKIKFLENNNFKKYPISYPYGDGKASKRIANKILLLPKNNDKILNKIFNVTNSKFKALWS